MPNTRRGVVIGLSPCDEARTVREGEVKVSWDKWMKPQILEKSQLVLGNSVDIMREAMSCYQNGAYLATAMMCRVALETAVYLSLTREPTPLNIGNEPFVTVTMDFNLRSVGWQELVRLATKRGLIDERMLSDIGHVRERGNFAAHFGQKSDKSLWVSLRSRRRIRGWVNGREALAVFDLSLKVMSKLMKRLSAGGKTARNM